MKGTTSSHPLTFPAVCVAQLSCAMTNTMSLGKAWPPPAPQTVFRAKHKTPVKTIQTSSEDKKSTHCCHHSQFPQLTTDGYWGPPEFLWLQSLPILFFWFGFFWSIHRKAVGTQCALPCTPRVLVHPEINAHFKI